MKFTIKIDDSLEDEELIITHHCTSSIIDELNQFLLDQQKSFTSLKLFSRDSQIFMAASEILFFETAEGLVYAHTTNEAYESNYRLYELLDILPNYFVRISKSTICNINHVYSISRSLSSSGIVKFKHSPKEVYVSRKYYNSLKESLEKRILL